MFQSIPLFPQNMYNYVSVKHLKYIISKGKAALRELPARSDILSPHSWPLSISTLILFLSA